MINGSKIRSSRENLKMTQQELADRMHVTVQAISQWENNRTQPDLDKITDLAKILRMTADELLGDAQAGRYYWELHDRMFSEETMYSRLRTTAQAEKLEQLFRALPYARSCHAGQTRYHVNGSTEDVPYIIHPLLMCCQAHALGIRDDVTLTAILLHDVCEDCGVAPEELPFSGEVREAVHLVTKDKAEFARLGKEAAEKAYYKRISANRSAMVVKCIDRCNNISTMALCFSPEKMAEYIVETETYIIPILDQIKESYMDLNDAAFLLKYQMRAMLETQKAMLMKL